MPEVDPELSARATVNGFTIDEQIEFDRLAAEEEAAKTAIEQPTTETPIETHPEEAIPDESASLKETAVDQPTNEEEAVEVFVGGTAVPAEAAVSPREAEELRPEVFFDAEPDQVEPVSSRVGLTEEEIDLLNKLQDAGDSAFKCLSPESQTRRGSRGK